MKKIRVFEAFAGQTLTINPILMELLIITLIIAVIVLGNRLAATHGKLAQMKREIEDFQQAGGFEFITRHFPQHTEVVCIRWYGCVAKELVLKRYHFTDIDSRDYVINCAEELIEKLEE